MNILSKIVAFVSFVISASLASAQGLEPGDIFVVSNQGTGPQFSASPAIRRVPGGGGSGVVVATPFAVQGPAQWDPWRQVIVFPGAIVTPGSPKLITFDGTSLATIDTGSVLVSVPAPVGDGRIYFLQANGAQSYLKYVDAAGALHDVLNAAGTGTHFQTGITNMIYDPVTNALFATRDGTSCGTASGFTIHKIPLNAAGTQVSGPTVPTPVCILPDSAASDSRKARQIAAGPNGSLVITVSNGQNIALGRMVKFDPVNLTYSVWAANGPYTGCGALHAGIYYPPQNAMIVLEAQLNTFHAYTQGLNGGDGMVVATDVAHIINTGTPISSMVLIPLNDASLQIYGTGTAGCSGAHTIAANSLPKIGNNNFIIYSSAVPLNSLGLGLVANAADVPGTDFFGYGFLLHLDLFTATEFMALDATSGPIPVGGFPAAIPNNAALVGLTYDAQTIWGWTGCTTPSWSGLSSSPGLAITILN